MRVLVDPSVTARGYAWRIWLYNEIPGRGLVYLRFTADGHLEEYEAPDDGREVPPTILLPDLTARQLRDALNQQQFAEGASELARDAIRTRDRLLTLVEGLALGMAQASESGGMS